MFRTVQRWITQALRASAAQAGIDPVTGRLQTILSSSGAAIVAYQIENGFIVCMNTPQASRPPAFVYCADHRAIADHIVAAATKRKLVGEQLDLFDNTN